jgi:bifunctional DNA-binding transcriptional regulator/antitoxin component of YhaV-PrlF toxin-antitoxin module
MSRQQPYDIVKVISGGRVTIPEVIRRLAKIQEGDHLAVYFDEHSGSVKYVPVTIIPKKAETT